MVFTKSNAPQWIFTRSDATLVKTAPRDIQLHTV